MKLAEPYQPRRKPRLITPEHLEATQLERRATKGKSAGAESRNQRDVARGEAVM